MTMFQKLVAIEPVSLIPSAEQELSRYAQQVELFADIPPTMMRSCAALEMQMQYC